MTLPRSALACGLLLAASAPLGAQVSITRLARLVTNRSRTAIEFIAPMPTEQVPNFHARSPNPDAWTIVLEISAEQEGPPITRVREGTYIPAPGAVVLPPTDLNGDAVLGDPHPAIPGLTLVMDDMLVFN